MRWYTVWLCHRLYAGICVTYLKHNMSHICYLSGSSTTLLCHRLYASICVTHLKHNMSHTCSTFLAVAQLCVYASYWSNEVIHCVMRSSRAFVSHISSKICHTFATFSAVAQLCINASYWFNEVIHVMAVTYALVGHSCHTFKAKYVPYLLPFRQ